MHADIGALRVKKAYEGDGKPLSSYQRWLINASLKAMLVNEDDE